MKRVGRGIRASVEVRLEFYSIPEPNSGCMLWLGSVDGQGYPKLGVGGKTRLVSHLVLERAGISIPRKMCACHTCDNPSCIEEKLFVGTQKANIHDMMGKGRQNMTVSARQKAQRTHCARGHAYSEAPRRNFRGHRICEFCLAKKTLRGIHKRKRNRAFDISGSEILEISK